MKKKNSLILDDEFIRYCELNNIEDIDKLAKDTFNRGFSLLKYPPTPISGQKDKIVEKEVVVEKIVEIVKEIPVEKIVEVIKEVPVEIKGETKIITKEVENTKEINKLKKENEQLKSDLNKLNESLNKFNRAKYMKNSDLGSLYSE